MNPRTLSDVRTWAALGYRCPTCRRMPGRRCATGTGRFTHPHTARIRAAVAAADAASPCPRLSPEGQTPCDLPDLPAWHPLGHRAPLPDVPTGTVLWATDDADAARWEGAA